jgi:hypothetical protein
MATNQRSAGGSKTPYEIRLELLQMSKDHLDAVFKAQVDFATQMTVALIAANKATVEEIQKLAPKAYSIDEVTKKAQELYSFVLKKD